MKAFTQINALAAPLHRSNIDTDAIIPKQFLKSIKRSGFGVNLFDAWRYLDEGYPGQDASERKVNPDFVLNQARYEGAQVLISVCAQLASECEASEGYTLDINLEAQTVTTPSGDVHAFDVDEFRRDCLLNGLDDIGLTLQKRNRIEDYESKRKTSAPWLFNA